MQVRGLLLAGVASCRRHPCRPFPVAHAAHSHAAAHSFPCRPIASPSWPPCLLAAHSAHAAFAPCLAPLPLSAAASAVPRAVAERVEEAGVRRRRLARPSPSSSLAANRFQSEPSRASAPTRATQLQAEVRTFAWLSPKQIPQPDHPGCINSMLEIFRDGRVPSPLSPHKMLNLFMYICSSGVHLLYRNRHATSPNEFFDDASQSTRPTVRSASAPPRRGNRLLNQRTYRAA